MTEVVKEIAKCWRSLNKEQRLPYKEAARKGKSNKELLTLECLITDKDRYEKQIKQLQGCSPNLQKPKKCLSAYMIFVKETRPSIVKQNPNLGALEIMKKVGELWQKLQNEEQGIKYF